MTPQTTKEETTLLSVQPKRFLQFRNTSEQFWHQIVIDGEKKNCWFWLSDKHLARLDEETGDYIFDECFVAGPVGTQKGNRIYYPVYKAKPRMKRYELQWFIEKWDEWAAKCKAAHDEAPEETIYEEDGEGIIALGKDDVLRITPILWAKDILVFSNELPEDYNGEIPEAFLSSVA